MNITLSPKQFIGSFQYFRDGSDQPAVHHNPMVIDINGDGIDEIIFAGLETQPNTPEEFSHINIQIFGWEDGQFRNQTDKWLPNGAGEVFGVGQVVAGDFNGNGQTDLFLTAYADMDHVFSPYALMNQEGFFVKQQLPEVITWQHGAAVADINGDGFDDVLVVGYGFSEKLYLGGPNGLQEVPLDISRGDGFDAFTGSAGGSGVALADFFGNGEINAIITDAGTENDDDTIIARIEVNTDKWTATFEPIQALPTPPLEDKRTTERLSHDIRVIAADFNADGLTDAIVYSVEWWNGFEWPNNSAVQFLQNQGDGNFIDVTDHILIGYDHYSSVPFHPQGLRDFNQDGLPDLFISGSSWVETHNSSTLLIQNTDGQFVDTGRSLFSSEMSPHGSTSNLAMGGDGKFHQIILEMDSGFGSVYSRSVSFPDRDLSEVLIGTGLSDKIWGFGGNDRIIATAGDDWIDGGDGTDTVVYSANKSNFVITPNDEGFTVIDNTNSFGTDTLVSVERLEFQDAYVALDLEGPDSAGAVYRLYQAALGRTPEQEGLGYWIHYLDNGLDLTLMSQHFIQSPEFLQKYGSETTDEAYVSLLYNNILGREPEQSGFDYWVDKLSSGNSRAEILPGFSESQENQINVIGDIENGIEYQLWIG